MSNVTPLSSGSLNGQTLTIELIEPGNDLPNAVMVKWPQKPTISSPAAFDKGGSRRDESPIERRGRTSRHPRLENAVNAAEALAEARRGLKGHNPGNN